MASSVQEREELELLRLRKKKAQAAQSQPSALETPPAEQQAYAEQKAPLTMSQRFLGAIGSVAGPTVNQIRDIQSRVPRQLGLTTRALVEGGLAMPAMISDIPVNVARGMGFHTPKTSTEGISDLLTQAGVPKPEGTLENVVQFGAQAMAPGMLGYQAGKVTLGDLGKDTANSLMYSSLKPTLRQHATGDAKKAVRTMLDEGINVTQGGVRKMQGMVDDIDTEVSKIISSSKNVVDEKYILNAIGDVMDKFRAQVNPQTDMQTIYNALGDFVNHPDIKGKIPVQLAQKIKQGTYRILEKKYGQLGSADVEAQKALARGLKEGIAAAEPKVTALLRRESNLINALDVAERRAFMDMNKNPGGLAWLTTDPRNFAAFMADKSALFKSLAARMLNSASVPLGGIAGGAAGAGLYGAHQRMLPANPPPQKIPLRRLGTLTPSEGPTVPEVQ